MTTQTTQRLPLTFIVCVDESAEAQAALKLACIRARAAQGRIVLLHVVPPLDFQSLPGVAEIMEEEQKQAAQALLARLSENVRTALGSEPGVILRGGMVGDEILAAVAEEPNAGLLVLGVPESSAARGRLVTWLASQLGGKLTIPLLLVPGNLTERQLQVLA